MKTSITSLLALLVSTPAFAFVAEGDQMNAVQQLASQFAQLGESIMPMESVHDAAIFPTTEPNEMRCWKSFRRDHDDGQSAATCAIGYELSVTDGNCYIPCLPGYLSMGSLCVSTGKTSYSRQPVSAQEQRQFGGAALTAVGKCPSDAPVDCGLICVDSGKTCQKEVVFAAVVGFKVAQAISTGNPVQAIMLGKQVFSRISKWPKCSSLGLLHQQ